MNAPHLYLENASLAYHGKTLFADINLSVPAGKWIGLLGPSGIGKSSLLRLVAGLITSEEQSQGSIYTDNHLPLNHQIAFMAQTDLLLPWLTVLGNVTLKLKLRHHTREERTASVERAMDLLKKVGLANAASCYPAQLSGGMRQRVALVRTLMEDKPIVLMDEPFSSLDAITRYKLQALAADLLKDKTVLFITHDPTEALRLAHSIYIMQGKIASLKWIADLASSTPREFTDPEVVTLQSVLFQELAQAAGDLS